MPVIAKLDETWHIVTNSPPTWQTLDTWAAGAPLKLDCDTEPEAAVTAASAIAIEFPAFNDGRGLSLAVLLRTRLSYTGELWATGAVHEDILHYMLRCGFTHFQLAEDKDADRALALMRPYSDYYQGAVTGTSTEPSAPSYQRVQRGRIA